MSSVFSKIRSGELPSYRIYQDEKVSCFLALDGLQVDSEGQLTLTLNNLPKGIYVYSLSNELGTVAKKLIVQ